MFKIFLLLSTVVVTAGAVLFFSGEVREYCLEQFPGVDRFGRSPLYDEAQIDRSYVLVPPMTANAKADTMPGEVVLMDLLGRRVHTWQTSRRIYGAQLMKDGTLLTSQVGPGGNEDSPAGGRTGILEAFDKDGNSVWRYRNDNLHHDFEILPNGNILGIEWYPLATATAAAIPGGIPGTEFRGTVWADAVVEIEYGTGREVWRWNSGDHLIPDQHPILPDQYRSLWTHLNGIDYRESGVGTSSGPVIAISFRNLSTVLVIEKETGRIVWESPSGMFAGQHAPQFVDDDTLLVFDNGWKRKATTRFDSALYSRLVKVNVETSDIEWEFRAGETGQERQHFYSQIMGNAQQLENGNVFVADGVNGRFFEVTPDKAVVWDMQSPFTSYTASPWENRVFFTAKRYSEAFVHQQFPDEGALPASALRCAHTRF